MTPTARLRREIEHAAAELAEVAARVRRIPLQNIVGSAALGPVTVSVGPGVFIPRPETEGLLEWASAQPLPPRPVLVDLCTGTGALALALSKFWPDARIIAVDDSDEALDYAYRNVTGSPSCRNWMDRSTSWSPIRPTFPTARRWNPKSHSMIHRMRCSVARTGWWSSTRSSSWRAAGSSPVAGVPSSMTTRRRRPPSTRSPQRTDLST